MPRIALEKEERGRRPRGRPIGRWEDQVWKDIERRGLQKMQVEEEETWNDRQNWRRLCTATRDYGNLRGIREGLVKRKPGARYSLTRRVVDAVIKQRGGNEHESGSALFSGFFLAASMVR
ncbi:hypothetical protein J6590_006701 [Homalodisca vitripennis]|nr:hypothetical protein J6590_006701 [Homalodisca vitripennis]